MKPQGEQNFFLVKYATLQNPFVWMFLPRVLFFSSFFIIFRPTFSMGEENHDLCRVFFQILPKLHFYSLYLVKRLTSHRGTVGSASACQARGHGFEPGLKRYIFYNGKYPGA